MKKMFAMAVIATGMIACSAMGAEELDLNIKAALGKVSVQATMPAPYSHSVSSSRDLWESIDADGHFYRVLVIKRAPKMPHTRNLYRYIRGPYRDIVSCYLKGTKGVVISRDELNQNMFVDKTYEFEKFLVVLEYQAVEINDEKACNFFNSFKIVRK